MGEKDLDRGHAPMERARSARQHVMLADPYGGKAMRLRMANDADGGREDLAVRHADRRPHLVEDANRRRQAMRPEWRAQGIAQRSISTTSPTSAMLESVPMMTAAQTSALRYCELMNTMR